jgi:hypothetical protein
MVPQSDRGVSARYRSRHAGSGHGIGGRSGSRVLNDKPRIADTPEGPNREHANTLVRAFPAFLQRDVVGVSAILRGQDASHERGISPRNSRALGDRGRCHAEERCPDGDTGAHRPSGEE